MLDSGGLTSPLLTPHYKVHTYVCGCVFGVKTCPECYNWILTPQSVLDGYEITKPHWSIHVRLSVGKYYTHTRPHRKDFPWFQHEYWERENETSAQHISIVSLPNPSFILPLVLSSVHLKNIKSWFMEMSGRDPTLRNRTTDDCTTSLPVWLIKITVILNTQQLSFRSMGMSVFCTVKQKH